MNKNYDWKQAYGKAPDAFAARVEAVVRRLEREALPAPRSLRWVPVLAAVLALMLGTAIALVHTGVLSGLHPDLQAHLQPGAESLVQAAVFQKGGALQRARFTVEEALWDGRQAYVAVRVSSTDKSRYLLMDDNAMPSSGSEWWIANDYEQGVTFSKKAADSGRALIQVRVNWPGGDLVTRGTRYDGEDILYTLAFPLAEAGELTLGVSTADVYAMENKPREEWFEDGSLSLTLTKTDARRVYELDAPAELPLLGATLRAVTVEQTPVATYLTVAYDMNADATDRQRVQARDGVWFRWLGDDGEPRRTGSDSGWMEAYGEEGYRQTESFPAMESVPERITLSFYSGMSKQAFDTLSIKIHEVTEGANEA